MQLAKLPLPRMPTSYSTLSRLLLPHSPPRSPKPSLALSSIAAPTTASAFLQASLSKMPRSNFSPPQHPAPRHFRSRLTTFPTSGRPWNYCEYGGSLTELTIVYFRFLEDCRLSGLNRTFWGLLPNRRRLGNKAPKSSVRTTLTTFSTSAPNSRLR
jgi:hypothetical protein